MPDAPDWFRFQPGSERHVIGDLGELAARLGSPVVYDRRGEVLMMDTFQSGVSHWNIEDGGGGGTAVVTGDYPFFGAWSAEMSSGGGASNILELEQRITPPHVNKWGLEVAVAFTTIFDSFAIELRRVHDGELRSAYVAIDHDSGDITIGDENLGTVTVGNLQVDVYPIALYHKLKIVGDFSTNMYVRLMADQDEYDLSAYEMDLQGTSIANYNDVLFDLVGDGSNNRQAQIGLVIVTANEP